MHLTIDYGPIWFWLAFYMCIGLIVLIVIYLDSKGRK